MNCPKQTNQSETKHAHTHWHAHTHLIHLHTPVERQRCVKVSSRAGATRVERLTKSCTSRKQEKYSITNDKHKTKPTENIKKNTQKTNEKFKKQMKKIYINSQTTTNSGREKETKEISRDLKRRWSRTFPL